MFENFLDSFAFALGFAFALTPERADSATLPAFPKNLPHFRFFQKGCADLLVDLKRLRSSSLLVPRRSSVVASAPPQILVWAFLGLKRATPARKGPAEPDFRENGPK